MTGITLICAGRVKETYYRDACAEYLKRLSAYRETSVVEIPEEQGDPSRALASEGAKILLKIPRGAFVVALCVEGETLSSEELSACLDKISLTHAHICVIIGSSNGLDAQVKASADLRLSLSRMTLPHSLARVFALEQLYRAYSILAGAKYHK